MLFRSGSEQGDRGADTEMGEEGDRQWTLHLPTVTETASMYAMHELDADFEVAVLPRSASLNALDELASRGISDRPFAESIAPLDLDLDIQDSKPDTSESALHKLVNANALCSDVVYTFRVAGSWKDPSPLEGLALMWNAEDLARKENCLGSDSVELAAGALRLCLS